ncbi:MAG TPA: HEAT repeat domain-containing protein [Actinomycetota bacterium]|nr:HEAT repeat domain-containing protein [Actinomycetota bacterium]
MRSEEQRDAVASGELSGAPSGASLLDAAMDAFAGGDQQASDSGRAAVNRGTPSPGAIEPPRRDISRPAPLLSTSLGERQETLARMMASGIEQTDVESVARVLLADPDAETRWMAAETLARSRARLPLGVIHRALGDPHDRIRAVAVRLAARRGSASFPLLIPLVTQRRSPMTQAAALDALRRILEEEGHLSGGELRVLLTGIAAMDPPPLRAERPGLEAIARAIGTERLRGQLGGSEPETLGAARLLLADASPAALRSVSGLFEDSSQEVRRVAAAAIHLIGQYRGVGPSDAPADASSSSSAPWALAAEQLVEPDLISSLARALADPEAAVRSQASLALERLPRRMVTDWAVEALDGGSGDVAARAASVVEYLRLQQAAESLLKRASGMPTEARAPYLGALSSLQLDPADLAALVPTVDPVHRQEAVRLSWQIGGRAVLPSLRPLLADTAGPVRMAVMEVLAESGEPASVEIAEDLLKNDSSAAVRATAVYALARSDPDKRLAALSRALADPDPDVRATAVEALPRGLASEMMELLLPALQDPDERVWQASLRHLAALPDHDLPLLWAALRESPPIKREELVRSIERSDPDRLSPLALQNVHALDPADRVLATQLAARAGTAESTAAVVAALSDPDPVVRRTAAAAMTTLRTPAAVGALTRSLADPQVDVRVEAVRALGMIDDDGVPPVLIGTLKDPELRVREMAAEALMRWHSPPVARQLAGSLGLPDLRRPAGDVLAKMGQAAVEPLAEVAAGDDVEAAAAAGALLERITGASTFAASLSSVDPEARLRAVRVLGAMGGSVAADALLAALSDPDARIRSRAATLLGGMGELRAVKPLRRMFLSDPVSEVAAAADSALRILGSVPQASGDLRVVEDVSDNLAEPPLE